MVFFSKIKGDLARLIAAALRRSLKRRGASDDLLPPSAPDGYYYPNPACETEALLADIMSGTMNDIMKGFDDAIGNLTAKSTTALGLLLAAGGVFGAVTSEQTKKKVILGIGAISAGIAAFFIPFSAADFVAANVGDGGSIVNLVGNFSDAVGKLDEKSLTALGGLLGVGAVFGAAPGGLMIGGKVALGMGVVGAAIAAFFVAFDGMAKLGGVLGADGSATKTLVTNMIDGIKPLQDIDGEKQDIILRMSHKNEPRWIALRRLYLSSIQDGYFKNSVIDIPALWDHEFDVAYDHWKTNLSGSIQKDEQEDAWIVA